MKAIQGIVNFFFPRYCCACGDLCHQVLCPDCLAKEPLLARTICRGCGKPTETEISSCTDCLPAKELLWVRSIGEHQGNLREVVHSLKYQRRTDAASWLAELMKEASEGMAPVDAVTFVPSFPGKKQKRGYNQAELLARHFARSSGLPLLRTLKKSRETPPQNALDKAERRENLRNAFSLLGKAPPPATLCLVDDVLTTGSTVRECARVLKRGGVRGVAVLTATRAVQQNV